MGITESIYDAARTTQALIKTWLGGDEMTNEEPVHDATEDIDAVLWNKMVQAHSEIAKRTRPGNLVAYYFSQADCTASQTDVVLPVGEGGDAAQVAEVAWLDGSLVGLAVWVEGARTAGTLTVDATVNGTKVANMTLDINAAPVQYGRFRQLPAIDTFSSLDLLGIKITTDGTWAAGATPALRVALLVSYGEEEDI